MSSSSSHSASMLRPVLLDTSEGAVEVSPFLLNAVVHNAERMAILTSAVLDAAGFPSDAPSLPRNFLLEWGAVLQLGMWELQGIHRHAELGLPTYTEASSELAARAAKGPGAFDGPEATPLSRHVVRVWLEEFAWQGWELLQTDVVVGDVDEDAFAEVMADFLWSHRDDLNALFTCEEE